MIVILIAILSINSFIYASDQTINNHKINALHVLHKASLCEYARITKLCMTEPDEVGLRYTFNKHGSNFAISDPIQSSFITDTITYNNKEQKAQILEIGTGFGLCAQKVLS